MPKKKKKTRDAHDHCLRRTVHIVDMGRGIVFSEWRARLPGYDMSTYTYPEAVCLLCSRQDTEDCPHNKEVEEDAPQMDNDQEEVHKREARHEVDLWPV